MFSTQKLKAHDQGATPFDPGHVAEARAPLLESHAITGCSALTDAFPLVSVRVGDSFIPFRLPSKLHFSDPYSHDEILQYTVYIPQQW